MGLFDTEEGVLEYERIADGYDGRELVERLRQHLPSGATVLELGMGPGKDLDLLLAHYAAVGSDDSQVFLDRYRARKGDLCPELHKLDAVVLNIDRSFDGIYSNKVLHHLTRSDLQRSFSRQAALLNPGGIALHSLWYGDKEEEHSGLRFVYYTEATLKPMLPASLDVLELERYAEMEDGDSMVLVLQKV